MTRTPALVISAAALLLVVGAFWQQRELGRLRTEHESLRAEAQAQGIGPSAEKETRQRVERQRRDPLAEARALADDLLRRAISGESNQSDWAAQAALAERVRALNPAQLRVVIDAILGAESVPVELRQALAIHFLGRLVEDFPKEVLARLEKDLRDNTPDHLCDGVISAAASRFAERDPDAAWEWFQNLQLDPAGQWLQPMQQTLLTGIGRSDPALALRRAEEAGIKGTSYLRQGERTTGQQLATLAALRAWSRGDPERQTELQAHIEAETLKPTYRDPNRFGVVTGWIEQAALPMDEIGFLADPATLDLCYHIDPRETGKWIEWLDQKFPQDQIERRLRQFFEDHRTKAAAQAWLDGLPPDKAAAFKLRLADE